VAAVYDTLVRKKIQRKIMEVRQMQFDELGNMNGREEQFALSYIGVINQYLLWCADRGGSREEETEQLDRLVDQYMYGIFS